jgi:hypothetical protein
MKLVYTQFNDQPLNEGAKVIAFPSMWCLTNGVKYRKNSQKRNQMTARILGLHFTQNDFGFTA